mmetsp:Transcript_45032/g.72336  ORF Transcript_45032/g.72336 Transcript_45032/m.72336 type:complete len:205 (-) Transcript_45032:250-864(-)
MEEELAPGGLSLHATVRLQKARLIALEKALSKLSKENLEYNSQRKMWEKKLADTSELNKQLKRSLQKSEQQMGKSKKSLNEAVNKARNSERELQVAKKELSSAQREREQLRSNSKNLDLKLNRAFAEIDKLKGKVKTQRSHGKATGMIMMVMKIVGVLLIINNAIKIRVGLTYYLLIMQVTPLGKSSSRQIQNFENFKRITKSL